VFGGKMYRLSDQNFDQIRIGSLTRFITPIPTSASLQAPSSEICPRNQARSWRGDETANALGKDAIVRAEPSRL
jgi:hypothetical protein